MSLCHHGELKSKFKWREWTDTQKTISIDLELCNHETSYSTFICHQDEKSGKIIAYFLLEQKLKSLLFVEEQEDVNVRTSQRNITYSGILIHDFASLTYNFFCMKIMHELMEQIIIIRIWNFVLDNFLQFARCQVEQS